MKLPENMQPLTPIEAVREPANYSGQCLLCGSPYEGTKAECKARKCRECIAREKQLGYVTEIAVIDEPAKDQPASGEGFVWMDESYPVATEAATQPPTGVEARVCEEWQARVDRVACMCRDDVASAIAAHSPWESKGHDVCAADDLAMTLIHLRHDKREIVNLIRWCLMGCPQPPEGGSEKP